MNKEAEYALFVARDARRWRPPCQTSRNVANLTNNGPLVCLCLPYKLLTAEHLGHRVLQYNF